MKSFTISATLLALIASVSAAPSTKPLRHSSRQVGGPGVSPICTLTYAPTPEDVFNALNHWLDDVINVNNFLNGATSDGDNLAGLAQGALDNAQDEPVEV